MNLYGPWITRKYDFVMRGGGTLIAMKFKF